MLWETGFTSEYKKRLVKSWKWHIDRGFFFGKNDIYQLLCCHIHDMQTSIILKCAQLPANLWQQLGLLQLYGQDGMKDVPKWDVKNLRNKSLQDWRTEPQCFPKNDSNSRSITVISCCCVGGVLDFLVMFLGISVLLGWFSPPCHTSHCRCSFPTSIITLRCVSPVSC